MQSIVDSTSLMNFVSLHLNFVIRRGMGLLKSLLRRLQLLIISSPALQDILEKCVRELGAIRLVDSITGVFGLMAWNSREFLGRFRTTTAIAWPRFLIVCWSILNFTPYIKTSIEPVDRLVVTFVGLMTPTLMI